MDRGLRTLPLAALQDGQEFLLQKYNISLIPSLHLTDDRYADIKNASVLAMGISEFEDKNPLPAVPVEIATIAESWHKGQATVRAESRSHRSGDRGAKNPGFLEKPGFRVLIEAQFSTLYI